MRLRERVLPAVEVAARSRTRRGSPSSRRSPRRRPPTSTAPLLLFPELGPQERRRAWAAAAEPPAPWRSVNRMHALSPIALPPAELAAEAQAGAGNTLVAGVALGSTGHIAAVTVATIVAQRDARRPRRWPAPRARPSSSARRSAPCCCRRSWPAAAAASGSSRGLRASASSGALIATAAVLTRSFPLLLLGTLLIGFGNASNQLSRYAAADMVTPDRRASAIGIVVWAATVGSVVGPTLVPIAGELADPGRAAAARRPVPRAGRVRRPRGDPVVRVPAPRPVRARGRGRGRARRAGRHDDGAGVVDPPPARGVRRDHRARRRPVRDGPDHDDDPAPHDRARPLARRGGDRAVRRTRSGCSRCRRSPAGSPTGSARCRRSSSGSATLGVAALMAAAAPPDGGADPGPRAVPARLRLEPRVRRGLGAPVPAPRAPRADAGPGRRRRADLDVGGRGEPRVRADHGGGRLHGAGHPRGGRR